MNVAKIEEIFSRRGLTVGAVPFDRVALRPEPDVKTVLITALPYYYETTPEQNLARFAALPDYHRVFGDLLTQIAAELKTAFPDCFFRPAVDNSPANEKKAACESGIAVMGDNHLCITDRGSFVFLGGILTDAQIVLPVRTPALQCTHCGKCRAACPTGALDHGYDPEKCLSFVTQKKGTLTDGEVAALRKNQCAWGCDRCAEACPLNRDLSTAQIARPQTLLRTLHTQDVAPLTDREYRERYGDRAFAWRGKAPMLRNLEILEEKSNG